VIRQFKLFQSAMQSIVLYSAQIWGFKKYDDIDKFLCFFIRRLLFLPSSTPAVLLLLETGQLPLYTTYLKIHLRYLIHVKSLPQTRYVKLCFDAVCVNKCFWYKNVNILCNEAGLQNVLDLPLDEFKSKVETLISKVMELEKTKLWERLNTSVRFGDYKLIKTCEGIEPYLMGPLPL
jgi:hypothetical protein